MSDSVQPDHFAFDAESETAIPPLLAKYPAGKQASAVIPMLYLVQNQMKRQTGSAWVPIAGMNEVARRLDMAPIRVYEVATFYTMFNLRPVGRWHLQVCTTTPCWLRGSDDIVAVCRKSIHREQGAISPDGTFTWVEMECLGACVNAPMVLIDKDPFEDLDAEKFESILGAYRRGEQPKPGPQSDRRSSEPLGGRTTLTDTGGDQPVAKI